MSDIKMMMTVAVSMCTAALTAACYPKPLIFDTPATDERGIMILGNGEVGATAWIGADGVLHTVLQNSDNWNEGGCHVKTGAVDYDTKSPVESGSFRQELSMERGELCASWKSRGKDVSLRYRIQHGTDSIAVCEVRGASDVKASVVNWRLYEGGEKNLPVGNKGLYNQFEDRHTIPNLSRVGNKGPRNQFEDGNSVVTHRNSFTVNADRLVPGGWCHVNRNATVAEMNRVYDYYQATGDLGKRDMLSDRVFGGLTRRFAEDGRVIFLTAVTSLHPCKDEAEWMLRTNAMLDREGWTVDGEDAKRARHVKAWRAFWERSHIDVSPSGNVSSRYSRRDFPLNVKLPLSFGADSMGGNRFKGEISNVEVVFGGDRIYSGAPRAGERIRDEVVAAASDRLKRNGDFRFACRFITKDASRSQRIFDNMTPGKSDGFLLDLYGGSVRFIVGRNIICHPAKIASGVETGVEVSVSPFGDIRIAVGGETIDKNFSVPLAEECAAVTRAYASQRYVNACAGRGRLPIRFNGSLFTIPHDGNPDYRRWGHGYWWQNTRLPYYTMFASGDFDMIQPLFRMYLGLLDFNVKRTRRYLGHGGAYFPECIQPWGDHFIDVYGTGCKWEDRDDKLQRSGFHKYEWVGQLELSYMLILYHAYVGDDDWFRTDALPSIREYLRYFDEHYGLDAGGRYLMHPSQACETWWECTNPMPEIAGLIRVTDMLLAMPERLISGKDRELFSRIRSRVPELPTRKLEDGVAVFAPAEKFAKLRNCETPELYCVFPFRLCSFEKPNAEMGRLTYARRRHKRYIGWMQDELNAAYLGMTDEARNHIAYRALNHSKAMYRWPTYWGPNFNWTPDQDEGGIFLNTIQSMLMQVDGDRIFLVPAWPKDWNCSFRLHAPHNTIVEGRVENGKVKELIVTPASRRKDVLY